MRYFWLFGQKHHKVAVIRLMPEFEFCSHAIVQGFRRKYIDGVSQERLKLLFYSSDFRIQLLLVIFRFDLTEGHGRFDIRIKLDYSEFHRYMLEQAGFNLATLKSVGQ